MPVASPLPNPPPIVDEACRQLARPVLHTAMEEVHRQPAQRILPIAMSY
jgi:hypothetical protein